MLLYLHDSLQIYGRVDVLGMEMAKVRTGEVVQPELTATVPAEMALAAAGFAIGQAGAVDGQVFPPFHLQAGVIGAQVDGVAATTGRLAADGAVAAHEGIGLVRLDAEAHRAAMTGPLQSHGMPSST